MVRYNMKENAPSGYQLTERNNYNTIISLTLGLLIALGPAVSDAEAKKNNIIAEASQLAIDVDFETAVIIPSKNISLSEKLKITMPSGEELGLPVQYQGGKHTDRFAKVIPDPTQAGNHVFQYWLKHAEVPGYKKGSKKGRIQINLPKLDEKYIIIQYRMYLHPDLKYYRTYPERNLWFVTSELWMGENWNDVYPYPFKITLGIGKEAGVNKPLVFYVNAATDTSPGKSEKWVKSWRQDNQEFEIPIGEWLDVEIGYKQGDEKSGRFYLTVKREKDDTATSIFDITGWTYSPNSRTPVPLTTLHPIKLYTSEAIVDHIRRSNGVAQIYFDDLKIWRAPKKSTHKSEKPQPKTEGSRPKPEEPQPKPEKPHKRWWQIFR